MLTSLAYLTRNPVEAPRQLRSLQVRHESHAVQSNSPTISVFLLLHIHQPQIIFHDQVRIISKSIHLFTQFPSSVSFSKPSQFNGIVNHLNTQLCLIFSTGIPSFKPYILWVVIFSVFSSFLSLTYRRQLLTRRVQPTIHLPHIAQRGVIVLNFSCTFLTGPSQTLH